MTSKQDPVLLNSSNGFKKRLLRPVSTNKQNDPRNSVKNPRPTNLKDTLSLKSTNSPVKILIEKLLQQHSQEIMELASKQAYSSLSKQLDYIKLKTHQTLQKQLSKIIAKLNFRPSSGPHKQNSHKSTSIYTEDDTSETAQSILSELQISSLEDGIRFLYQERKQMKKVIETCFVLLAVKAGELLFGSQEIKEFNGNEGFYELLLKMVKAVIEKEKEIFNDRDKIMEENVQEDAQKQVSHTKFRAIFTARDDDKKDEQIKELKTQISLLNATKTQLNQKLIGLQQSLQTFQEQSTLSTVSKNTYIRQLEKQVKDIYSNSLIKKQLELQKLRAQLSSVEQAYTKLKHRAQFCTEDEPKNQRHNANDQRQYTVIVQEEFEKMRAGFMRKLEKFQKESQDRQLKVKKELFAIEKQFETVSRQRNILLKKNEFLMPTD